MQSTRPYQLAHGAAVAAFLVVAANLGIAHAQTPFDGQWSVEIVANTTACAVAYAVPIEVADGKISYGGGFGAVADGNVGRDGVLQVQLTAGSDIVKATGALADRGGLGRWSSATLKCKGTWTARRG